MSTQQAQPPATLPPGARRLLARLDALSEEAIATCPRLAEAIRERQAREDARREEDAA